MNESNPRRAGAIRAPRSTNARAVPLLVTALLLACAAAGEGDPGPVPAVAAADTTAPLAERWEAALARAAGSGTRTWIGWSIRGDGRGLVMSNTGPASIRGRDGERLHRTLGIPAADAVALLFGLPAGASSPESIVATRLRALRAPADLAGESIVWLGGAGDAESVALLESIFPRVADPGVQTEFGPMVAVHENPAVAIPALRRIATGDEPEAVRAEAVAWISYQRDEPEARRLLREIVESRPAYAILDEAWGEVEGDPALLAAWLGVLANHPDPDARALAAENLAVFDDPEVVQALTDAAAGDPSSRVREEARDALEEAAERRVR